MPDLDQQLNPTFSPDGNTVLFRALLNGRSDIFSYDLTARKLTNLTDDDAWDFGPTFSPDGRWVYYSSVRGTKSKIFRFHPDTPDSREQITYGDWNDEDPALSPDGKRLFFISDRDSSIYNVYSIHLETGETFMHTNVVAGVFTPTVFIGKDNTEKLVYSAYYKGRFTLYIADSKKPFKRLPELAPVPSPVGPGGVTPFQPAIEVSVDPEKVTKKISRKLQLEDAQINAGINTDQTFVSNTVLIFGDNLGDRRFYAIFQSLSSFTNFDFIYLDLTHRLQKGIELFDDRTYFLALNQNQDQIIRRRTFRITGGMLETIYPLSRYHRLEGQLGYISRSFDFPFAVQNLDGSQTFLVDARTDNYPQVGVAFVGDTVNYREWGPLSGHRYRFGFSWAPDLKRNATSSFPGVTNSTGSTLTQDVTVDLRRYINLTDRSLLAVRLFGARSTGNFPDVYYFGGLDTLRGLDFREQIGNTIAYANFEFRFPLIDLLAFPFGGFTNIRGHFFVDVGGAALKDQKFRFWDASQHQLLNGKASYGYGLQIQFLGLLLHWDFAHLTDFRKTYSGLKTSFYIGTEF